MRRFAKIIIIGVIIIAPIVLLSLYTLRTIRNEAAKTSVNVSNLKLVTPVAIIDEITKQLEEENLDEAFITIGSDLPDPNIPSSNGTPLVVLAAEKGYIDIVASLIQKGADPNKADLNTSETALIKAVRNKDLEMVQQVLLFYGADPNLGTNQGLTPLGLAIDLKDKNMANLLIGSGAINGISEENLLLYAFKKNDVGVELMLSGKISPNITDKDGNTPLIIAAANGDLESAKHLIAYRAKVNVKNKVGMTPLLYAVKGRHTEMAEYLINNGAKINPSNIYGQNAIFWAAYNGDSKLVHNLLMLGANYEKKTRLGQTPLQIAKALGHTETVKMLEDFIAYKNLPRDSNGNIILPQVNQEQAANATSLPAGIGADMGSDISAGIMTEINKTQEEQAQQDAEEAQQVDEDTQSVNTEEQNEDQGQNVKTQNKTQQNSNAATKQKAKTEINKLQTSNSQPEMPQMPGGMDMPAIMGMMGGAQSGQGGNMGEMLKQMQNMGSASQNKSKTQQMANMPQGMNIPEGANMPDISKMMSGDMQLPEGAKMPKGMQMPDMSSMAEGGMPDISKMMPAGMQMPPGMDMNSIMDMDPEQLKQMGIPEDQIAQIKQAKQQMGNAQSAAQTQNNSNGFKPKDLSSFTKNTNGRVKTQINKLQTSGN